MPLVLGLTEANPHLLAPGVVPRAFATWRDRVRALHPRILRVLVDWARVQPRAARPPDLHAPADGCLRGRAPCAPFSGLRAELRAAHRAGLAVLVTFLGTPRWAASRPSGCRAATSRAWSRMPDDIAAYRALVRAVLAEARRDGVAHASWSAWNEPNHPEFLAPQRPRCASGAPTEAAAGYATLVRALRAELRAAGGQRVVLGEAAGLVAPRAHATGAAELIAALPRDVVCSSRVWAQHAYVRAPGPLAGDAQPPGSAPLLAGVEAALDARGCPGPPAHVWITETGVEPGAGAAGCRAMADALRAWAADPRVDAAFQYTFRDDTAFPVGVADARLRHVQPAYAAWAGGRCRAR